MSSRGSITVRLIDTRIIECIGAGFLLLEDVREAQAEIERIFEANPLETYDGLFDGLEIEGFTPGLPVKWAWWWRRVASRVRRVALVARPPMLGIGHAFRYLVPALSIALFTERTVALAFLRAANDLS